MIRRTTSCVIVLGLCVWGVSGPVTAADAGRVSFDRDVLPALTAAGCNTGHCHGSSSAQENGRFRLSMFESNPERDYAALVDGPTGPLVDIDAPDKSRLLRNATGELEHAGAKKLPRESWTIRTLQRWIAAGAPPPHANDPRIERVIVEPQQVAARIGESFHLAVRAVDSDGGEHDVTDRVMFRVQEDAVVVRAEDGSFRIAAPGATVIVVKYARRSATATVRVPFGEPAEVTDFEPAGVVDRWLMREWRRMALQPAGDVDDWMFARRSWVHLTGRHPEPNDVLRFVASTTPDKRLRWIERALANPAYAEHWSHMWEKWLDMLATGSPGRERLAEEDAERFNAWLRNALSENQPASQIAADLLTATGTTKANPAAGYLLSRASREATAESAARFFLGVESRCFRCHDHPIGNWRQKDYHGLVATFAGVGRGFEAGLPAVALHAPDYRDPETRRIVAPEVLGQALAVRPGEDPRRAFHRRLTGGDDLHFARSLVNRYWQWLMSEPLLPDPHDAKPARLSLHGELLNLLARNLAEHDYDLKYLLRTICLSRAYQLANEPTVEHDETARRWHYRRVPQRLPVRIFVKLLEQATEVSAAELNLSEAAFRSPFMPISRGRSPGGCDLTSNTTYLSSALHLLNNDGLVRMLQHPEGRAARLAASKLSDDEVTRELFLATLLREPNANEIERVQEFFQKERKEGKDRSAAVVDLLWALVNAKEFVFLP